nr:hypothetical protein [uncultured Allomuricauda sp.]
MTNQSQQDFLERVQDSYGSTQELANVLDMGVEMLFYLEESSFHRKDVQNVAAAMRAVIKALRETRTNGEWSATYPDLRRQS